MNTKKLKRLVSLPTGDVSIVVQRGRHHFSVQRHEGTYGYNSNLFEVSWWRGKKEEMKEPIGWLSAEEVFEYYEKWKLLK